MWGDVADVSWRTLHATVLKENDPGVRRRAFERTLRPPAPQNTEPGVRVVQLSGSVSASSTVEVVRAAGTPEPDPSSFLWVRLPDAIRTDDPSGSSGWSGCTAGSGSGRCSGREMSGRRRL